MKIFLNIDNHIKGLFFMLMSSLCFATNDAIVKYSVKLTNNDFTTLNVIFIRGIFTSVLILSFIIFFTNTKVKYAFVDQKSYLRGIYEVY